MNNEQYQKIINQVWKEYADSHWIPPSNSNGNLISDQLFSVKPMMHNRETFINELKTNPKFANKWGLKIEEKELSLNDRILEFAKRDLDPSEFRRGGNYGIAIPEEKTLKVLDKHNIPTKLITITYKDKTTEVYE